MHVKYILSLSLVRPFITLSILDRITSKIQLWSLTNELPVADVLRHQYI